jgi:putative transcriptional regulator
MMKIANTDAKNTASNTMQIQLGHTSKERSGKIKRRSRILEEMHETASDLYSIGLISKLRMAEFDALCHLGVPEMPPKKIKSLREASKLSQAVFAAVLNTSISTVQKWEIGDKKPSGPSLKLLNLIERKGLEVVL